jgi:hypothetical protein
MLAALPRYFTARRVAYQTIKVQRLDERYADLLQVGFLIYHRVDFQPRGEVTAAVFSK